MLMVLALVAVTSAGSTTTEADQRLARMTDLYERACLKAFPDDNAVAAMMVAANARELSQADVAVTMRDDPARAWDLNDGGATLWIEFPPYHTCSVRWNAPQIGDLSAYRAIAAKYQHDAGGFEPVSPFDSDQGDIHVHAVGETRILPDKSTESMFVFDQHITDPKRREAGETGFSVRFVHQYAPAVPSGGN
jgi:hypothetical protein